MKKISIFLLAALVQIGLISGAQDLSVEEDLMLDPAPTMAGALNNSYLNRGLLSFEYNISFPMGEFSDDFISKVGFRGGHLELKGMINDYLSVGGSIGWYGFFEKYPRSTYEFDEGAITTTVLNYYYSLPLKAVAHYYVIPSAFVQPFIGLSLGVTYNELQREIGIYYLEDKAWDFTLTPELGVLIPFGNEAEWGAVIKGRYNHVFYNGDDLGNIQTVDLTIGLVYAY